VLDPPDPPPNEVIVENTELFPFVGSDPPFALYPPEPPAPTVTVIADPEDTAKSDAVLNPPAPPPPANPTPPPPPPATTRYSTVEVAGMGVIEELAVLAVDVPLAFVAVTVNV
jgi:hypothetical protein